MSEARFRAAGGEVPPAPRALSPDMRADANAPGRMLRILGAIWAVLGGGATISLAALGAPLPALAGVVGVLGVALGLLGLGLALRRRAEALYRTGLEARGAVTRVEQDFRQRINGRYPWRVRYTYETPAGPQEGVVTSWTEAPPDAAPGQRLVVLYDPAAPGRSVVWTRLAPLVDRLPERIRVAPSIEVPSAGATAATAEAEAAAEDEADAARAGRSERVKR